MTREQINNLLDKIDDFRYDLKNTAGVKEEVFVVASVIVVKYREYFKKKPYKEATQ